MEHGPSDFKVDDVVLLPSHRVARIIWKGIDKCEVETDDGAGIVRFMVEYRLLKLVDKTS